MVHSKPVSQSLWEGVYTCAHGCACRQMCVCHADVCICMYAHMRVYDARVTCTHVLHMASRKMCDNRRSREIERLDWGAS